MFTTLYLIILNMKASKLGVEFGHKINAGNNDRISKQVNKSPQDEIVISVSKHTFTIFTVLCKGEVEAICGPIKVHCSYRYVRQQPKYFTIFWIWPEIQINSIQIQSALIQQQINQERQTNNHKHNHINCHFTWLNIRIGCFFSYKSFNVINHNRN